MVTTKNSGARAFSLLVLGLAIFFSACQPPGPKALLDGERLIREGEYDRALKRLNKAAQLLPENAQVWNHIGLAQHGLGRYNEAVQAYQQALKLNRNLAAVHFNLGVLLLEVNRLPDSITEFTIYTTIQPENPEGWLKLGTALLRAGRPDEAEHAFLQGLKRAPKDPELHNNLGLVHVQRKRPREAMQCFNNALHHSPGYAPAILNQAIVAQHHLGNKRAALERYQAYLETTPKAPNTPEIQTIISELHQELNPPPVVAAAPQAPPASGLPPSEAPPTDDQARKEAPAERAQTRPTGATNGQQSAAKVNVPAQEQLAASAVAANAPPLQEKERTNQVVTANQGPELPESEAAPEPDPEPESQPEPIPVEIVELSREPILRLAVPPPATAGNETNAEPEPQELQLAQAAPVEPERPLLVPRSRREEEPGLLNRVNPMRLFRRDEMEPEMKPAPRVVPEQPRPVPGPIPEPIPLNVPRYSYSEASLPAAGDRAEAERIFTEAIRAHQQKRFAAAIELYKRTLAADPTHFEATYNLGLAAYQAGDLPESLLANERAVRLNPRSLNARYNFALALRDANYPLDAVNELQKLLEESPNETRAHFALANIYAQDLEQPQFAQRHYQRVLTLEPNHPDAGRIRRWLAISE